MNILGFSGITTGDYYRKRYGLRFVGHDSSAALICDGRVVFAMEEERLSREKHTSALPLRVIEAGLAHAGMTLRDVDAVAYSWHVDALRLSLLALRHPMTIPVWYWPSMAWAGTRVLRDLMSARHAGRSLEAAIGQPLPRVVGVRHHFAHAACAFLTSPFEEAAVLTVDGQGEDESATLGTWCGKQYTHFQSVHSPNSIGILYGLVTDFLGMRAAWDEYKVMAMAALGDPARFARAMSDLVQIGADGQYRTRRTAMVFQPGYCDRYLARAYKTKKRTHNEPLDQVHFDIAAALQAKLEEVLFHLLRRLRDNSDSRNLCLSGGVFLNSVANGKIQRSGMFERVYVPPVPGDHGGALGAALAVYSNLSGREKWDCGFTPFLGLGYSDDEIVRAIAPHTTKLHMHKSLDVIAEAADLIACEKIIAWFQGRMEYGPRALGHRSILANPARAAMKDLVNTRIKHREEFRPFAGAVPLDDAHAYFEIEGETPYMQFVVPVHAKAEARIEAVTHLGTCRAQTVTAESDALFYQLLKAVGVSTGTPVILNTSFNDRDEPIVCTPHDAIRAFLNMDLDALVIGGFVVTKAERT